MNISEFVQQVNGDAQFGNFDNYSIEKLVGTGGSAKVYLVRRNGIGYAMKIPLTVNVVDDSTYPVMSTAEQDAKFKKEATTWGNISIAVPDDVVCLIDYYFKPFPWMVMELADGDFDTAIRDGTAKVSDVVELLRSLDRIHDAGLVHRDIKPGNILRVKGRWKFSDFGLSKMVSNVSLSQAMVGTPVYLAPEQVSKNFGRTDARTDIWQMGIMLYQMVVGRSPYDTTDIAQLAMSIITDGPYIDAVPAKYRAVLSKALTKEMVSRYQTAAEFADDLEKCISSDGGSVVQPVVRDEEPAMDEQPAEDRILDMGMREYKGIGSVPDYRSALSFLQKSDSKRAYAIIAIMKAEGQGTRKDRLSANMSIHKVGTDLSVLGDDGDGLWIRAMVMKLGLFTLDETSDPQKLLKASSLKGSCLGAYYIFREYPSENHLADLVFAADSGYSPAQLALGDAYRDGKFIEASKDDAERWYQKAAGQGDADAQDRLDHLDDPVVAEVPAPAPKPPVKDRETDHYARKPIETPLSKETADFQKNLESARNGSLSAQMKVAYAYRDGKGVERSMKDALVWFSKAAYAGLPEAEYRLGYAYEMGQGISASKAEAYRWYRLASEHGNKDADQRLAMLNMDHEYGYVPARKEPAAKENPGSAQRQSGASGGKGNGKGKTSGSNKGSKEEEDFRKKLQEAKSGDRVAQYLVSLAYRSGNNVEMSKETAFEWCLKSANKGYNEAEYAVGVAYEKGDGVQASEESAVYWYKKSAAHGNPEAMAALERFCKDDPKTNGVSRTKMKEELAYLDDEAVFERDMMQAMKGSPTSQLKVANAYREGKGVRQSFQNAFFWYSKAANAGLSEAEYRVGHSYEMGQGVEQSDTSARLWYKKASSHGNSDARARLSFMNTNVTAKKPSNDTGSGSKPSSGTVKPYGGTSSHGPDRRQGNTVAVRTSEQKPRIRRGSGPPPDYTRQNEEFERKVRTPENQYSRKEDIDRIMASAESGDRVAQYSVGHAYKTGEYGYRSDQKAFEWFMKSAKQHYNEAELAVAKAYENGQGVARSEKDALTWYKMAAEHGNPDAIAAVSRLSGGPEPVQNIQSGTKAKKGGLFKLFRR